MKPIAHLVFLLSLVHPAGAALAQFGNADELLPPEEAFRISAERDADQVRLRWDIAEGYYLYRNRFKFSTDTAGASLGEPVIPPGKTKNDEFFGEVQIFRGTVEVELPVTGAGALTIQAISQGCADLGVCYPPYTHTLALDEPANTSGDGAGAVPKLSGSSGGNPLAALAKFGVSIGGTSGADEFLPPDEAFQVDAEAQDDGSVKLSWAIAEGYYLYRDKINVSAAPDSGATVASLDIAPGKEKEDEYFGKVEVFYVAADAKVALQHSAGSAGNVTLNVGYQGCADAGLCYPPITKALDILLPVAAAASGGGPGSGIASATTLGAASAGTALGSSGAATQQLSEQDRIARSLASGGGWLVVLGFFGFGLLLAFTPCVLPMIPILSSIIVGQGDGLTTRKAFLLSLIYVLAMAATYALAGVIAALFGQNLQILFQDPWVLAGFSLVFVLLALSMFGFYELQLPSSWQARLTQLSNRQEGGTYIGVGIMGLLSALIVGPCVAPPLAGALIYIGQSNDALLGGTALFFLALGMGAPLLVLGASAGKLLPKAGPWMNVIKGVFGVVLLGVAIYLIERVIPAWIAMLLWAALLIVSAVFMGALDALDATVASWRRLAKGGGLIVMVYGVLLMVGAASGGGSHGVLQPLKGSTLLATAGGAAPASHDVGFKRIKGVEGLRAELALAASQGRPVMLDYYADWCVSCIEMERYTFTDSGVQQALTNVLKLQTDVTANDKRDQALLKEFGLFGPPAILFFGPDGVERPQYRLVGFVRAGDFRKHVEEAVGGDVLVSAQTAAKQDTVAPPGVL